ncbi:MAG: 3-hydroxyacyl-CoA dehydrogenase/enoyl-CoA hydratase family protein [Rickettsiaceae bacterium]|nr:3-hydroxyacyl-CoA dehydrogenase/enoyl-CoA hydratase family protein [Rickettsiaceae bacterium]
MIEQVAVFGAGVMGSGIACQLANNGIKVKLFDLQNSRELIAASAIERQLNSKQSGLVHPSRAANITPLSLTSDLNQIYDCDLVIEAVIEKIEVKQRLYNDAFGFLKEGASIVSNTSTFKLANLIEGLPANIAGRIGICHFFNPPRHMRLLEFVPGNLNKETKNKLAEFMKSIMGKEVIECYDSPGFIANRLGCYLMETTLTRAIKSGLSIEQIDKALIDFFGFPSTGIFALYDLIGLDVMNMICASLKTHLPTDDPFLQNSQTNPKLEELVKNGFTGRKGKGGFYKIEQNPEGVKTKYRLNLENFEYEISQKVDFAYNNTTEFLASNSAISIFIKDLLQDFFIYVLSNQATICESYDGIDKAMKLGFAWKQGPYELMQNINLIPKEYASKFPPKIDKNKISTEPNALNLIKDTLISPLYSSDASSIWNINNKKLCLEINTKMHILTSQLFEDIINATKISEESDLDLIIYSDNKHFSAGADLSFLYQAAKDSNIDAINKYIELGQNSLNKLKYSRKTVISCAPGVALGGGCELLLHSDYIIAHQELNAGLVETSLGLIPSFGGIKEAILSAKNQAVLDKRLNLIIKAYKSSSALDFKINMDLENYTIMANRDAMLEFAINNQFTKKVTSVSNFQPQILRNMFGELDTTQEEIVNLITDIPSDSLSDEQNLLKLERQIFCALISKPETIKKISEILLK